MPEIVVAACYRFVRIEEPDRLRVALLEQLDKNDVSGTILVAGEGINGTIAATREGIDSFFLWLRRDERFADIVVKESICQTSPFSRTKVKIKREIVTMGVDGIDPEQLTGTYVEPADWNELISDPDVLVIDTRNHYEVSVGAFENAVNPETETFRSFPDFVERTLDPSQNKKVAMYCTGGIRCEKSTSYLKQHGFDQVYHLKGGILKYLEEIPQQDSRWRGECFVFDERVTVNHQLEQGSYAQCHACRHPISSEEQQSEHYERGVSCPHCYDTTTPEQRERFAEREKQATLAKARSEPHFGSDMTAIAARRRAAKIAQRSRQAFAGDKKDDQ